MNFTIVHDQDIKDVLLYDFFWSCFEMKTLRVANSSNLPRKSVGSVLDTNVSSRLKIISRPGKIALAPPIFELDL